MADNTRSGISQATLDGIVLKLFAIAKTAQAESNKNWTRNVIDPFAALFEITGFQQDSQVWKANETRRQAQKTLQNHIGEMHQQLLSALPHWDNLATGKILDVVNKEKRVVAEIKNKYSTVTGSKLKDVYDALFSQVNDKGQKYEGYTAYFVQIIPKTPERYDKPFTPPDNKNSSKRAAHDRVRVIDGASFYALAHGAQNAIELIFLDLVDSAKRLSKAETTLANLDEQLLNALFRSAFAPKLPSS